MKLDKSILHAAGKLAVAAELCRRNVCPRLSHSDTRNIDLSICSKGRGLCRVKVATKQGPFWPQCRGIAGKDWLLVLVDFARKSDCERPDFYVLTASDWRAVLEAYKAKYPGRRLRIAEENDLINEDEVSPSGNP